jgi:hypothetical protein
MLDVKNKMNTWMNIYFISFKSGRTQWENGDELNYNLFMFCTANYILPATS